MAQDKNPEEPSPLAQQDSELNFHLSLKVKILVGAVFIALIFTSYLSSSLRRNKEGTKSNSAELDQGQVAKRKILPNYVFTDATGKQQHLVDYTGNVLVMSFWASWCSPCLVELPTFSQIENKYHDQGLRILAINVEDNDDGKKFAADFWSRNKFNFASFFDSTHELSDQLDIDLLPSNFVVDKSGRLAFSGYGSTDWNSPQIIELLEGLLAEGTEKIDHPAFVSKGAAAAPGAAASPAKKSSSEESLQKQADDVD